MARPRLPARLCLRQRRGGKGREWVIRDGQIYRRTGLLEEGHDSAIRMLRAYVLRVHGREAADAVALSGATPKRETDTLTVYFIGDGQAVKIGVALNLIERFAVIQAHCPQELVIYGTMAGGMTAERELHTRFSDHRIRGEWFRIEGALKDFLLALPNLSKLSGYSTLIPAERHSSSKLTPGQVEMIRQNPAGLSGREFARLFGISEATVSEAKSGVWWKHVA